MFSIEFSDGVHVTIFGELDMQVNELSFSDVEFNNVVAKAESGDEASFFRLVNLINNRLGVEAL